MNRASLVGYGRARTKAVTQQLSVPAGGATPDFWLRVVTAETTRGSAYDRLQVRW